MIIKNILAPKVAGTHSAEEIIFRRGVGDLYTEIRDVIMKTELLITDTPREEGDTRFKKLPSAINRSLGESLTSLGWKPRQAPGAAGALSTSDWAKVRPSGLKYMGNIGIALEVQLGNHYQFHADVQRLGEAILQGEIIAGISIVPSDRFALYKADRGASFSNASEKLERWIGLWVASGAILLPSIMILAIEFDGFINLPEPGFRIKYPLYDPVNAIEPIEWREMSGLEGKTSKSKPSKPAN